jgi:hypothetical protein
MFHQLHCLVGFSLLLRLHIADVPQSAIRHVFWQLMDSKLDPIEFEASDGDTSSPN